MLFFHFLIILIFLFLIIWTVRISVHEIADKKDGGIYRAFLKIAVFMMRYFPALKNEDIRKKQKLLVPSGDGKKETKKYLARKLAEILLIVFIGNILGMGITCKNTLESGIIPGNRLLRNTYGGGDSENTLTAEVDGKVLPEELQITVGERQLDSKETEEAFKRVENMLYTEILGENRSLDHVDHDLCLPENVDGENVTISWRPDTYECIEGDGRIRGDFQDSKGMAVILTAELSYFDKRKEIQFPVRIYPAVQSTEEAIHDALIRKIGRIDEKTVSEEELLLPGKIGDKDVTYRRKAKQTGALILFLAFLCGGAVYIGRDRDLDEKIKLREKEMLRDYPEILSKMILLFSAGMTIRGAVEKLVHDYEKRKETTGRSAYAYEELRVTLYEMNSGVSEAQAYENLGNRVGIRHYSRLGALLSQNLRKGSAGLLAALEQEAGEAFAERKASARKRGEEAGTKLLLPMGIMLLIVMVIVIIPAFLSFSL